MRQKLSAQVTHHPLWLLTGFWICTLIAIAAVARRLSALRHPSHGGPAQIAAMDANFASHSLLTVIHIIPAAIFVTLAAFVLMRQSRGKWTEIPFFLSGLITGVTAYAMSLYAIGGWIEVSAVLVFDTWFLIALGRAWWLRVRGDDVRKRQWITRAVGILLGIATTRPVMGVFFATSSRTHLSPNQFFGIAFWIGFSINALVIELWIHSRRRARMHPEVPRAVEVREQILGA